MTACYVIGVDQGTSGTKAVLVDHEGRPVAEAGRPIGVAHPEPGWVEQDPEAMVANVVACVRELLAVSGVRPEAVAGLGIDNHTETLVVWERGSGRAVLPAIVWQCRRSTAEAEALDRAETRRLLRRRTGLDLDPTFTATKLAWIFRHRPEIAAGLREGRLLWGTVDCWLVFRLSGGTVYATESSNASRTMLFDIGALQWDPELVELFELTLPSLPELRPSAGLFGTCHPDRFGARIPITAALGDQQAALLGQGCVRPGELKCTYGTGAFVWMNAGHEYRPAAEAGYLQTVAWHLDRPTYALEGFVMYAGAMLDWLVDRLGLCADVAALLRCAESAGGSSGVALVPAFQGLASPWWDPRARAALFGLGGDSGKGEMGHAALEAICFQVRRVLEDMAGAAVQPGGVVRADGGLTRSEYLMQMQADVIGLPLRRAGGAHVTPCGAALMAGLGAGLWSDLGALEDLTRGGGASYRPRPGHEAAWSERYAAWLRAVARCREWSAP